MPNISLVNIPEIQILLICLILKRMHKIRIRSAEPSSSQHLVLLLVLPFQVETEVDHRDGHAGVAGEMHAPRDVIPRCVPV